MRRLDEVATRRPSTTGVGQVAFPQTKEKHWKEEVLSHYPGKVLDVGARMPGFKLMMQNEEGHYGNATYTLKFESSMFIYDPQKDISQWVPVRGVSASLMSSELRSANDLNNMNPYPYDGTGLVQLHSPMLVKKSQIWTALVNLQTRGRSGTKTECGDWSCCPPPPLGESPTWAEATAEMRRRVIIEKDSPTWEEVICSSPQKKNTEK